MAKIAKEIISPQNYLDILTGKCYIIDSEDDNEFIDDMLADNNIQARSYGMDEIDRLNADDGQFALVDALEFDGNNFFHAYKWRQLPDDYHGGVQYV